MLIDERFKFINEEFYAASVLPKQMDLLWAGGWRHFGRYFFRYNVGLNGTDISRVWPLRIRVAEFSLTKSQRRVLRRNSSLRVEIGTVRIDETLEAMFEAHKLRFVYGVPESIFDFLSPADDSPSDVRQLSAYEADRMVAASFFDVGAAAMSGVYAVFDPVESGRSLGIFTLLKEIEFAAAAGLEYYYLGYSYEDASFYDYKKRFRASEVFDWESGWEPFSASSSP